jgi:hypothetical protein
MPRECTDTEDSHTEGHDHHHSNSRHRPKVARLIFGLMGSTSCEYHGCAELRILRQLTAHVECSPKLLKWPCMHASDVLRAAHSHGGLGLCNSKRLYDEADSKTSFLSFAEPISKRQLAC